MKVLQVESILKLHERNVVYPLQQLAEWTNMG